LLIIIYNTEPETASSSKKRVWYQIEWIIPYKPKW